MTDQDKQINFVSLAEDYGFSDSYELEIQHGIAVFLSGLPKLTEQRDALEKVEEHSQALQEALEALGFPEMKHLRVGLGVEYIKADELVKQTIANCGSLRAATERLIPNLRPAERSKPPIWHFVRHMADYWYKEKGEVPRCYPSSYSESGFDGDFFYFILKCSSFTEKKGSNINKIIKKWKKDNGISTK